MVAKTMIEKTSGFLPSYPKPSPGFSPAIGGAAAGKVYRIDYPSLRSGWSSPASSSL